MQDNLVLYLLIGIGILSLILIVFVVIYLLQRKKASTSKINNSEYYSNPSDSNAHDAHLRTFKVLNENPDHIDYGDQPGLSGNEERHRNNTEILFGSSNSAPMFNNNSSKTMMSFDDSDRKVSGKAARGQLATITYNSSRGLSTYTMNEPLVRIGRDPQNNDIIVDSDKQIGRMHGVIMIRKGKLIFLDLNSKNGSFIKNSNNQFIKIDG